MKSLRAASRPASGGVVESVWVAGKSNAGRRARRVPPTLRRAFPARGARRTPAVSAGLTRPRVFRSAQISWLRRCRSLAARRWSRRSAGATPGRRARVSSDSHLGPGRGEKRPWEGVPGSTVIAAPKAVARAQLAGASGRPRLARWSRCAPDPRLRPGGYTGWPYRPEGPARVSGAPGSDGPEPPDAGRGRQGPRPPGTG